VGGDTWECRVLQDDGATLHVKRPNGAGGPIPADRILEKRVYPPERHHEGFEIEYRRRLDAMHPRTGAWCLDLAQWCFGRKLDAHLPYLLRTAHEEETLDRPILEAELLARWEHGTAGERATVIELLERFYPKSSRVRDVRVRHLGLDDPRLDRTEGTAPARGTGDDRDLARRAAEALKRGRDHFGQAAPGSPGAAGHRDDALEALREAQRLYEELAASGSSRQAQLADRKLTDVIYMISQLRKDAPIK